MRLHVPGYVMVVFATLLLTVIVHLFRNVIGFLYKNIIVFVLLSVWIRLLVNVHSSVDLLLFLVLATFKIVVISFLVLLFVLIVSDGLLLFTNFFGIHLLLII